MKRRLSHLALLLLILLLFGAPPLIFESPLNNPFSNSPVVLLVGDFSPTGFGSLVTPGVDHAIQELSEKPEKITVKRVSVLEPLEVGVGDSIYINFGQQIARLRRHLIERIANDNVIAIISANTSSTAQTVLEVGRTFHIPVLLTVATNDRLIRGFSKCAFRLLPRDGKQAEMISRWCARQLRPKKDVAQPSRAEEAYIAVAYDPRQYGQDLQESLRQTVGNIRVLPFPLGTTTETAGILSYASTINVKAWILLGYKAQAIEFYAKRMAFAERTPLLMSDGAYGSWLSDIEDEAVFISFPLARLRDSGDLRDLPGYSVFGHDAILILQSAVEKAVEEDATRQDFASLIRKAARELTKKGRLAKPCIFDRKGENMYASFGIYPAKIITLPVD